MNENNTTTVDGAYAEGTTIIFVSGAMYANKTIILEG